MEGLREIVPPSSAAAADARDALVGFVRRLAQKPSIAGLDDHARHMAIVGLMNYASKRHASDNSFTYQENGFGPEICVSDGQGELFAFSLR